MEFKKIISLILLIGSVFVLSDCVLQKEESAKPVNINFTQTGNLSKEGLPEPRLDWLLLYEKPGNPALTVTVAKLTLLTE